MCYKDKVWLKIPEIVCLFVCLMGLFEKSFANPSFELLSSYSVLVHRTWALESDWPVFAF